MKLDSHQHFWRYDAPQYPWIPKGSPLHRDWLPDDLAQVLSAVGMDGSIAVQARQSPDESSWLLELADTHPRIHGVVGWVDLRSEKIEQELERFASHPKFVGVRHVVQDEPDDNFMLGQEFQRGISKLRKFNLVYDVLVYPRQLRAAVELVRRFPEQRFVLDHIAKPFIRDRQISPWNTEIRELATAPNVWCKISGMVTEARHDAWQPKDFQPYMDVAIEAFGIDRLMFGSDWPVCLLAARYDQVVEIVTRWADRLSESDREKLFGENCRQCYLLPRAPRSNTHR